MDMSWKYKGNIRAGWWYTYSSEKLWSSSVGMMTFPSEWKVIIHSMVPNHQPAGEYMGHGV
jgi:hypothetical protein